MFQGLRTAIYRTNDLAKAKAWYADAFGVQPYFDEPFYVGFNIGGYELGLQPATPDTTYGTNVEVYWGVPDAHAAFQRLRQLGATEYSGVRDVGGGILVACVNDPFGNILGVIQNPHFRAGD